MRDCYSPCMYSHVLTTHALQLIIMQGCCFPCDVTGIINIQKELWTCQRVQGQTCALAHSLTLTILSWLGWKTCPTLPMGCGSVVEVGKCPFRSSRPNRPRQPLWRSAVLGRHQGTNAWPCSTSQQCSTMMGHMLAAILISCSMCAYGELSQ